MFGLLSYVLEVVCCLLICTNAEDPLVETKYGYVLGSRGISRNNRTFLSFRGIPYAKPPIGDLRFRPPQSPSPWSSPLNATVDGPICIQIENFGSKAGKVVGQEDCLYLNIYVPERDNSETLLPVMVFIHGGGFTTGSGASTLYGPEYIIDKDVVLVTINYRLGAFGLLTTIDDAAPGNYGFKDQVLALRFVNENIENFGGDKKKITIFGESAGSGSVSLHMVSPLSKGLFQQAICESGVVFNMFSDLQNQQQLAQTNSLAEAVGCKESIGNSTELITCLVNVDSSSIVKAQKIVEYFILETKTELNPEPFLEKSPKDYIQSGDFQKIPWIVGANEDEGNVVVAPIVRNQDVLNNFNANFKTQLISILGLESSIIADNKLDNVFKNITEFYLRGDNYININNSNRIQGFINLVTDRSFTYSTYQNLALQFLKGHNKIWLYNFGYRGNNSFTDLFAGTTNDINFDWGVTHIDEIPYLFYSNDEVWGRKIEGTDLQMSQDFVNLWTNFAIFGDPDPSQIYNWEAISFNVSKGSNQKLNFLNITGSFGELPEYNLVSGYLLERMDFWMQQQIKENL